jgi:hypothetical protein
MWATVARNVGDMQIPPYVPRLRRPEFIERHPYLTPRTTRMDRSEIAPTDRLLSLEVTRAIAF